MTCRSFLWLLLPISFLANAETPEISHRCLRSESNPVIRLEWRQFSTQNPRWEAAYIRYNNKPTVIPIILASIAAKVLAEGSPWEYHMVWNEILDGQIGGKYTIDTQGANVLSFSYHNPKTQKTFNFIQDNVAYTEEGCHW